MSKCKLLIFFFLIIGLSDYSYGQFVVKGKITDAKTGEGLPFVNVFFPGSSIGTTTDFEGYYTLKAQNAQDSIRATYIGFVSRTKALEKIPAQSIDFQLSESLMQLDEVVIHPGENPAFPIMRKVIENKDKYDKRSLEAYQYESYNKIEVDINNISEKFKKRKIFQKVVDLFDSLEAMAGEDGEPVLPLFLSESVSDFYFRRDPEKRREIIKKTRFKGVGLEDASLVSQLIGSTFQEYNFYQNYLTILNKQFVSPISNSWKTFYYYLLSDSSYINGEFCYKLDVDPKVKTDLAFYGSIWVSKESYALKQVDLSITKNANLNYVEAITIQQELTETAAGAYLPTKNRVIIRVANLDDQWAGFLAKFYTSNENIIVNEPKETSFYDQYLTLSKEFDDDDDTYWTQIRHDSLSDAEQYVYNMIDSINDLPVVKTYVEIIDILVNGYKDFGPLEIGPHIYSFAFNNIENSRFRLGFKTNYLFSDHWTLSGYGAYGSGDGVFKYGARVDYLVSKQHWTKFSISRTYDLFQVSVDPERLENNNLFYASTFWGNLRRPFYSEINELSAKSDLFSGITAGAKIRTQTFEPHSSYGFGYGELNSRRFRTTELEGFVRITRNEKFILNDNERISLGSPRWPIFTLRYTKGLKNTLDSDFEYDKMEMRIEKKFKMGFWGVSRYDLNFGKIYSTIPYPLLNAHLGNANSVFYTSAAFNLMRRFEFVSDEWVSLRWIHFFEGNILNRVPLISKLKWRMLAQANVLFGSLGQNNINIISVNDENQNSVIPPLGLNRSEPYIEVGYGIENIFKFLRLDAFHRITYLGDQYADENGNKPPKFGVKMSLQFIL